MKIRALVFALCIPVANCGKESVTPSNRQELHSQGVSRAVTRDQAVELAKAQALREHKSLDSYNVNAREETKTWSVEFQLKDFTMGGGLTFIIDKETGKILERRESQ